MIPVELLKSLITFVESPNIVAAAERLRISQPFLSKQLKELERQSDQPLFGFEGRKKVLTRYGQDLYRIAKSHMVALENDLQALRLQQESPATHLLRVAGRRELLERMARTLKFKGQLEFQPMAGREVTEALVARRVELGISQHPLD
jgi:DNA-binding transcriptional LysR family regulator